MIRKWMWFFVSIFVAVWVAFFLIRGIFEEGKSFRDKQQGEILRKVSIASSQEQCRKLTAWVCTHSDRISIDTARFIAQEAIITKKPLLMLALIEVESNFIPTAVSSKGAIGLTQIMDVHTKGLIKAGIIKDRRDLFNVSQSVHACNFILDDMLKKTGGNVGKALDLYLGGKDGAYKNKILGHLGDLYILTLEVK